MRIHTNQHHPLKNGLNRSHNLSSFHLTSQSKKYTQNAYHLQILKDIYMNFLLILNYKVNLVHELLTF